LMFVNEDNELMYFFANIKRYHADPFYGVVIDSSYVLNSSGDKVVEVTLFIDGEEYIYELDDEDLRDKFDEGDFVEFTLTNGVIESIVTMIKVEDINDAKDCDKIANYLNSGKKAQILSKDDIAVKEQLLVDEIDDEWLIFEKEAENANGVKQKQITDVELCEDGYIIYDLTKITPEMIENINDIIGSYVVAIELTDDEGAEIIVVIK